MLLTNPCKLNSSWVIQARDHFKDFLEMTVFPDFARDGLRGSCFTYTERMIMSNVMLCLMPKRIVKNKRHGLES